MPHQLANQSKTLESLGVEKPLALTDPLAWPLSAVVWLGGCSASFVSPDGLIITNHHCANSTLQCNSTPECNLIERGFLARNRKEELPGEIGKKVWITQDIINITERMTKGLENIPDPLDRHDELENRIKTIIAEHEDMPNGIRCSVKKYFGGQSFYLIKQLELRDIRLVYAPEKGIGWFGGDVDNWRWPRHTGDYTFLRAYIGPDGKPAEYAEDNVPYQPEHYLKIASQPLQEGDFVMVAGYPGWTQRWKTAEEAVFAYECEHPKRIYILSEVLQVYQELANQSESLEIKTTPSIKGVTNYLQKLQLVQENFEKAAFIKTKRKQQAKFNRWIQAYSVRKKLWAHALDEMNHVIAEYQKNDYSDYLLHCLTRYVNLIDAAHTIVRMAEERPKPDAERDPEYQQRNWDRIIQGQQRMQVSYDPRIDKAILKFYLEKIDELEPDQRQPILNAVAQTDSWQRRQIRQTISSLFSVSLKLEDVNYRVDLLNNASLEDLKANTDPMIQLALRLRPLTKEAEDRDKIYEGRMILLRPHYVEAMKSFLNKPLAPDANGTLRVTYGTVKGYRPAPKKSVYKPFSTLTELVDKHTGQSPFNAPSALHNAAKKKQNSPFYSPSLEDVPVNFLADLDITGGNSGSATLNSKGELAGLVFDGNSEWLVGDWIYGPDIQRSIHVDIRYILWIMQNVDHADNLLAEMDIENTYITGQTQFKDYHITSSRTYPAGGTFTIEKNEKNVFTQDGHVFYIGGDKILGTSKIVPGTDITGDGKPNLLFYEWSGGAHCCYDATVMELSEPIKKIAVIKGHHSSPVFKDLDGDNVYEIILRDWTYEYWPQSFAGSPAPEVILKYKNDIYVIAAEFMIKPVPGKEDIANSLKKIQYKNQYGWPSQIFRYALDLMYTGHEQLGWDYIDKAWPKDDQQNKQNLVADLKQLMKQSPYWSAFKKQLGNNSNKGSMP